MTELSDSDKSKINAETASVNKKKAEKVNLDDVLERIEKYDGIGLKPEEVWALYEEVLDLKHYINTRV